MIGFFDQVSYGRAEWNLKITHNTKIRVIVLD
jgi:hypothetical protein